MSHILKKIKSCPPCVLLRREYWRRRGLKEFKKYDDVTFVTERYRQLGRELNLAQPQRFTEKLQWLKLFWRNDLMPICSDKYEVRGYLEKKGYGELLNDLIAVYENLDDFDPKALPERFVLKAAHGSGWNLIVRDKTKINWFWWKKIMRSWMKQNLYWFGREWNYEKQTPRIIVEKYLEDDSGELRDFKIFCMNGEPKYVQIDENRATKHKRIYVDCEGKQLPMSDSQAHNGPVTVSFGETQLKMIELARELAAPFAHVRMDFYECGGKIYFGEMTFFDGSGFYNFEPDEWDLTIGKMLNLPEANYNLEILNRLREQ